MTFWVAGAVVAAGAIGAIGATSAASTQAGAAENAQQISQNEFNTITAQEQPFIQGGYGALSALEYGLGIPNTSPTPAAQAGYSGNYGGPPAPPGPGSNTQVHAPSDKNGMPLNGPGLIGGAGGPLTNQGVLEYTGSGYSTGGVSGAAVPTSLSGSTAGGRIPSPGLPPSVSAPGGPASPYGFGYGSLTTPFTTANWQQLSPAYNFQLQQGQQGVLSGDAANYGSLSGAAAKDLINYNQGTAASSFNNAFNMYQTQQGNIYSRLSGIASLGQNAATNTGAQGTALAGQAAQSATNIGTAQAGGIVGASNAVSGSLTGSLPWLYAANSPSGVSAASVDQYGMDEVG